MNILYVSSLCSREKYKQIFENSKIKPGLPVQKYHRLIVEGFQKNENTNITMLSAIPISSQINKKIFFKKEKENTEGKNYIYIPFINMKILRQVTLFIYCFFYTLKWCLKNKEGVVICDILNISISSATWFASKCSKTTSIAIVTDIPQYLNGIGDIAKGIKKLVREFTVKVNTFIMNKFDTYVFLTNEMNNLINKNNKKFVVIEGQVDVNMNLIENTLNNKYEKKVCMYAGSLKKIYGIKKLTEAFLKANIKNSELHIYGSGDFEEELINICKQNKNIKYMGVKDNDHIVKEEIKATVLINPRPTNEEYTKYSFPSKNMEYMVSGTPIITTKLAGMPKEYYEHVYLIEDESIEGLVNILNNILKNSKYDLNKKGLNAKKFVLEKKNNIIQTQKIINMITFK